MKLTAYVLEGHELDIRPAPVERGWMDATGDSFAYRAACRLPSPMPTAGKFFASAASLLAGKAARTLVR
jgi:hypothetical protein